MPKLTLESWNNSVDALNLLRIERARTGMTVERLSEESFVSIPTIKSAERHGKWHSLQQRTIDKLNIGLGYTQAYTDNQPPKEPPTQPEDAKKRYFIICIDGTNDHMDVGEFRTCESLDKMKETLVKLNFSEVEAIPDYFLLIEGRELTIKEEKKIVIT